MKTIFSILILQLILSSCSSSKKTENTSYSFSNQQLDHIPDSVFMNKNVVALIFGSSWAAISPFGNYDAPGKNYLRILPEKICQLKKLKTLDLSFNDIRVLPSCFTRLKKLEDLNLSYNDSFQLYSSLDILKKMRNLKRLNLFGIPFILNDSTKIHAAMPNVEVILTIHDLISSSKDDHSSINKN